MTPAPITIILNPNAGRGKARHIQAKLRAVMERSGLEHTILLTERRGHAIELSTEAARHSSIVVAVGGDGTVNEVASGVVGTDAALAVLSEGSGNDFARLIDAPSDPDRLVELLRAPAFRQFDAGSVKMIHTDGDINTRYFFNTVGIGFDAAVARRVNRMKYLRGIPLYLTALLRTMRGYRTHYLAVNCNGEYWQRFYFLLCIGNGKWEGGGFKLTPDAEPDDGKFQVCGVSGNSLWGLVPVIPSIMKGEHLGKPDISAFDTSAILIQSTVGFPIHGDGEPFGFRVIRADVKMHPGVLKVVVPHTARRP